MSGRAGVIKVGSIIHLTSRVVASTGGQDKTTTYLKAAGLLSKKKQINNYHDPLVRSFVFTAPEDEDDRSMSWQILSADRKPTGASVLVGDNIYLRNLADDVGYLDSFEWVRNLTPFREFPMEIGVFTATVPERGGGLSGTWTVESADGAAIGTQLVEDSAIYLRNGYNNAGHLYTYFYPDDSQNTTFTDEEFTGVKQFAFTGLASRVTESALNRSSRKWTICLSSASDIRIYNYYSTELLKGRRTNLSSLLEATQLLLDDALKPATEGNASASTSTTEGTGSNGPTLTTPSQDQNTQLLNLKQLKQVVEKFQQEDGPLHTAMKQSLTLHQAAGTIPPLHRIRRCFQQLAVDIEVVQRATMQRRKLNLNLVQMDRLAAESLAPFKHLLDEPTPLRSADASAVITYFSEKTHARHLPYTNQFILVGVSYDLLPPAEVKEGDTDLSPFEHMAIPHEIGHFVYEHGKIGGKSFEAVSEQFSSNPYYRWCEEIFSDVYGCIVAGPLSAISLQVMLVSTDRDRIFKDDEKHPTPMLRPYILSEILRIVSKESGAANKKFKFDDVTDLLDEEWTKLLNGWGFAPVNNSKNSRPTRLYLPVESEQHFETIVNADRVVKALRPIIVKYTQLLLDDLKKRDQTASIPWSTGNKSWRQYGRDIATKIRESATATSALPLVENANVSIDDPTLSGDERLAAFLHVWGPHGPTGFGGH